MNIIWRKPVIIWVKSSANSLAAICFFFLRDMAVEVCHVELLSDENSYTAFLVCFLKVLFLHPIASSTAESLCIYSQPWFKLRLNNWLNLSNTVKNHTKTHVLRFWKCSYKNCSRILKGTDTYVSQSLTFPEAVLVY